MSKRNLLFGGYFLGIVHDGEKYTVKEDNSSFIAMAERKLRSEGKLVGLVGFSHSEVTPETIKNYNSQITSVVEQLNSGSINPSNIPKELKTIFPEGNVAKLFDYRMNLGSLE